MPRHVISDVHEWINRFPLSLSKNPNEKDNFSVVRKVLLRDGPAPLHRASLVTERKESLHSQKIQGPLTPLSKHLTRLYEGSGEGKSKDKKRVIHWLLCKCQGVFSQNENDLGQTNLVEHTIDTSEARPIKQPPHHLSIAFVDEDHKVLDKLPSQGVI